MTMTTVLTWHHGYEEENKNVHQHQVFLCTILKSSSVLGRRPRRFGDWNVFVGIVDGYLRADTSEKRTIRFQAAVVCLCACKTLSSLRRRCRMLLSWTETTSGMKLEMLEREERGGGEKVRDVREIKSVDQRETVFVAKVRKNFLTAPLQKFPGPLCDNYVARCINCCTEHPVLTTFSWRKLPLLSR